jgi:hypothetical protein
MDLAPVWVTFTQTLLVTLLPSLPNIFLGASIELTDTPISPFGQRQAGADTIKFVSVEMCVQKVGKMPPKKDWLKSIS